MQTPQLSIVIPVHNGEATLARCLDAILKSTFTDFEIIVVNDGSTDDTAAVLEGYLERDPVRVLHHNRAGGAAHARNAGAAAAGGDLVCFIDSDIFCATVRMVRSAMPPAPKGTTIFTSLLG